MSHNAYSSGRGGTSGDWPTNVALTPAEFAWFAKGVFEAINGDQGGSWTPASVITIGGAGVAFTTVSTTFYGITCTGSVSFVTLGASGNVGVGGDLSVSGNVYISGGSSGAHKALTVGIYVDTTINGALVVDNTSAFGGTATFNNGANFVSGQNVFLRGSNTFYGFNVPAGNTVISDSPVNLTGGLQQPIQIIATSGTITAGTRYALSTVTGTGYLVLPTGHPTNAPIQIINLASDAVDIRNPAGTTLGQLAGYSGGSGAGQIRNWAIMYYDGSSWQFMLWSGRLT